MADLKEILDEIQETIDNAEEASKAIGVVSEMHAQAKAAVEGKGVVQENRDGSTTTIGFGTTSAAAEDSTKAAVNPPMLNVRKKNKRPSSDPPSAGTGTGTDSAPPEKKGKTA